MQQPPAPTPLETLLSYPRWTIVYLLGMGFVALLLVIPNQLLNGLDKFLLVVAFLLQALVAKLLVFVMRRRFGGNRLTWNDVKHFLAIIAAMIVAVAIAAQPLSKSLSSSVPSENQSRR